MKALIVALAFFLVSCGGDSYKESGVHDNEDYSSYETIIDGDLEFKIPEGFKLESKLGSRSDLRSYHITDKPSGASSIYLTVDKLESESAARVAVATRHEEYKDHENVKANIEGELLDAGYKRIVTSNYKQEKYLVSGIELYNTNFQIETSPEKIKYSFYFFNIGDEFFQGRLITYKRDFEKDDLNFRRIINSIKISE